MYGYRYRNPKPVARTGKGVETLTPHERDRLLFVCMRIDSTALELVNLRFERDNLLQKARGRLRKRSKACAPT